MIITKVSFDCTIAMPGYSNVKPGIVEADLEPGETIEQAWTELNERAIAWHKKEFPHLYQEPETLGPFHVKAQFIPVIDRKHDASPEGILSDINCCKTLEELKTYKTLASSDPTKVLYNAYCNRIKELSK